MKVRCAFTHTMFIDESKHMKAKSKIRLRIVTGPDKAGIFTSLQRSGQAPWGIDLDRGTSVCFKFHEVEEISKNKHGLPMCLNVSISSIGREDGSGNRWLIEGCPFDCDILSKFTGYYDSNHRVGWLEFEVES